MVILGVAAREASIGQKDAMIHGREVVVVVVTAKNAHYIAFYTHVDKQAGVELGSDVAK